MGGQCLQLATMASVVVSLAMRKFLMSQAISGCTDEIACNGSLLQEFYRTILKEHGL